MTYPITWKEKLIFLDFESVRLRAEVYVNQNLAAYDCIGNTPFRADVSDHLHYGGKNQIAIRITDPGGNFYWEDYHLDRWGAQYIPPSHGFGGITGRVRLLAKDHVFIEDLYIQNQPEIDRIRIYTTFENQYDTHQEGVFRYVVKIPGQKRAVAVIQSDLVELNPGANLLDTLISIPDPLRWSPDQPHLYILEATWIGQQGDTDVRTEKFGFRWFEAREVDGNKAFYLNNKRIFLTSAISWGFWPENGIFPTPELAEKQVRNLKKLGLNMFNFHRAIGQSILFEKADELGILVYEEPGGYRCPYENIWFWKGNDPANTIPESKVQLAWQWRREKLNRMVKRDRSHPSLVIYNMGNEMLMDPDPQHKNDIAAAHLSDPSRYITFSSHSFHSEFFPEYPEGDCPVDSAEAKLFMAPFDHNFYYQGWWDNHHALGEGCYRDEYYNGKTDYNLYSDNESEIVFYGEEGAIHAPARLDLIVPYLDQKNIMGWDSNYYRKAYSQFKDFLRIKGFEEMGLSLESLSTDFANNSYYYHGKMIENCRIGNTVDAYVINGLEDPKRGFYSGILDIYRNIKGDPEILAKFSRPHYLSIKPNKKIIGPGDAIKFDIFIVNENVLHGEYLLEVSLLSGSDTIEQLHMKVRVKGGDLHGELLAENLDFHLPEDQMAGYLGLEASLRSSGEIATSGQEQVFKLPEYTNSSGMKVFYEGGQGAIHSCLNEHGMELMAFEPDHPESNLLIATTLEDEKQRGEILEWVSSGHRLLILENTVPWALLLHEKGAITFKGVIRNDAEWTAGGYFNKVHPVFKNLPSQGVMGWEYQGLTCDVQGRHSLLMEGEEAIVGALDNDQHRFGTAMGEIKYGHGTILFSTLDLQGSLQKHNSASQIGECIILNMVSHLSRLN